MLPSCQHLFLRYIAAQFDAIAKNSTASGELRTCLIYYFHNQPNRMTDDFIVAKINNERVPIQLGLNRPKFKDFNGFEKWLLDERIFATALKDRLEAGENLPHSIEQEMINWSQRTKERIVRNSILNTEKILLQLDIKIKLALKTGSPDFSRCFDLLHQLKHLNLTPLMLKKHPEVVKTIEKVTRFKGKRSEHKVVKQINKCGRRILKNICSLFNTPYDDSFVDTFNREESIFYGSTHNMTITDINMLIKEP